MRSLAQIGDNLAGLLPSLSRNAGIVDDGARLSQIPHPQFVDNLVDQARVLQDAAIDLAGHKGFEGLARTLGHDSVSVARKAGVMHGMQQSGDAFTRSWHGSFNGVVDNLTDAVRALN